DLKPAPTTASIYHRTGVQEKDRIFNDKLTEVADFCFGENVASVFDDMLDRSVPFYQEIQRMIGEMAADFASEGTNGYDLGCSTGTTMLRLDKCVPDQERFTGADHSRALLARCRTTRGNHGFTRAHA